jgi:hypothetical protein
VTRKVPLLALVILAMAFSAGSLPAATVTLPVVEFALGDPLPMSLPMQLDPFGDDLLVGLKPVNYGLTAGSLAASQPAPESKPAPEPEPEPEPQPQQQLLSPAAANTQGPTGGTMSSTSVTSSSSSSSSIPPADLCTTPDLLLATSGELLTASDWLFIPPRFLDGIFRPPRHVVSL